jgi:DNA primase
MSRIPQSFIDELVSRADVAEIIGTRVTLKRAGREYKGLCPFHTEKTPSFYVIPEKGFYHCFGCGAHGTAIGFLMSYDNLGFREAVEALAEMVGMEVPAGDDQSPRDEEPLLDVLRHADQIYRRALRDNEHALAYLGQRGIDGATAGRFGIGYAPAAWDTVLRALGGSPERVATLLEAGLIIENEQGRRWDRFRDRIMFPIRDARGRVIGFGGRVLGSGEPKYLNSPESAVFHKRSALYGLYEARQQPGKPEQMIVVEGYLDVASLVQHGIAAPVATLGTATTPEHVRRLTRLADRVVFCFDGDRAGRGAAWRALETVLPYGGGDVKLEFLLLPEGEDPDTLVRKRGAEAFKALLAEARPLSRFFAEELRRQVDLGSADGRARLVALAKPLLARLPGGIYRQLVMEELASAVGLSAERLEATLEPAQPAHTPPVRPAPSGKATIVRKAILLALHYPSAAAGIGPPAGLEDVEQPGVALLCRLLEVARKNPKITLAGLVEHFREDPEGRHLGSLAAQTPLDGADAAQAVLRDTLEHIVREHQRRKAAQELKKRLSSGLRE